MGAQVDAMLRRQSWPADLTEEVPDVLLIVQHAVTGTRGKSLKVHRICEHWSETYGPVREHRKRSDSKQFQEIAAGS